MLLQVLLKIDIIFVFSVHILIGRAYARLCFLSVIYAKFNILWL